MATAANHPSLTNTNTHSNAAAAADLIAERHWEAGVTEQSQAAMLTIHREGGGDSALAFCAIIIINILLFFFYKCTLSWLVYCLRVIQLHFS